MLTFGGGMKKRRLTDLLKMNNFFLYNPTIGNFCKQWKLNIQTLQRYVIYWNAAETIRPSKKYTFSVSFRSKFGSRIEEWSRKSVTRRWRSICSICEEQTAKPQRAVKTVIPKASLQVLPHHQNYRICQ